MKKALLVCAFLALGFASCTSAGGGGFRLLMQDLPIDMDHVWITFGEISLYQENGDFKSYETKDASNNPLRVDLLTLRDNNLGTIFSGTVDAGTYEQLRLVVTKASAFDQLWEQARTALNGKLALLEPEAARIEAEDFARSLRVARMKERPLE